MGCLSAKTSHFVIGDINQDQMTDIGIIKEKLFCEEVYDERKDVDILSGPIFKQDSIQWYIFTEQTWIKSNQFTGKWIEYKELPLIEIKITPLDVFGFNNWQSYNPKDWDHAGSIQYVPSYRKQLIKEANDSQQK